MDIYKISIKDRLDIIEKLAELMQDYIAKGYSHNNMEILNILSERISLIASFASEEYPCREER